MINWIKQNYILIFIGLGIFYWLFELPIKKLLLFPPVMSTGVSTDGRYVITAHAWRDMNANFDNNVLVLWNVKDKSKQIIDKNVNPFSAYFIPDSHEFMWQDNNDIVHIQNVEGKTIKSFKHVRTQGHLMSADKQTYLSTTPDWWIYSGYGENRKLVLNDDESGSGQPLNLSLSGDYFLTSGSGIGQANTVVDTNIKDKPVIDTGKVPGNFNDLVLWDKNALQPVIRIRMHNGKIFAFFSPDGQWIISGDETGYNYMWSMEDLDKYRLAQPFSGIVVLPTNEKPFHRDKSQLLPPPPELKDRVMNDRTVAYAFLTETDFVHLGHTYGKKSTDSVIPLYTVGSPWIKGYLDLQEKPRPSLDYYSKSLTVASSYKAHVLVTGQAYQGGINVYQYHPDKKELERIWVGGQFKYW